jgi:hypothetical protein
MVTMHLIPLSLEFVSIWVGIADKEGEKESAEDDNYEMQTLEGCAYCQAEFTASNLAYGFPFHPSDPSEPAAAKGARGYPFVCHGAWEGRSGECVYSWRG